MANQKHTLKRQQQLIRRLRLIAKDAREAGIPLMYIIDCGDSYDFDTTGTPTWSEQASDTLTAYSVEMIQEDQHQIDELLNQVYEN